MKGKIIQIDGTEIYGYVSTSQDVVGEDSVIELPESTSGLFKKVGNNYIEYIPEIVLGYKEKRASEYPARGDQLDEIWKLLEGLGATSVMLDSIKTVKSRHPKI